MAGFPVSSAREAVEKIRSGELSAENILDESLMRIREKDQELHAYLMIMEEKARAKAKQIDQKVKKGMHLGKLAGVTIAIKDNLCTKGINTTCSSRMLQNFRPTYNATVVEKLEKEDAVIVAKNNLPLVELVQVFG